LAEKVDKVAGKGLSEARFSIEEKNDILPNAIISSNDSIEDIISLSKYDYIKLSNKLPSTIYVIKKDGIDKLKDKMSLSPLGQFQYTNTPSNVTFASSVIKYHSSGRWFIAGNTSATTNNHIMTSYDGITWAIRTTGSSYSYAPTAGLACSTDTSHAIYCYGNKYYYSTNNGQSVTEVITNYTIKNIAYSSELKKYVMTTTTSYVGVVDQNNIATPIYFNVGNTNMANHVAVIWTDLPERFVFVGGNNGYMVLSPDLENFTIRSIGGGDAIVSSIRSTAYSPKLDMLVVYCCSSGGVCPIKYIDNFAFNAGISGGGINFKPATIDIGIDPVHINNSLYANNSIIWCDELEIFVAVAGAGTNRLLVSRDGINWKGIPTIADAYGFCGIAWSPEISTFVAILNSGPATGQYQLAATCIPWQIVDYAPRF
jgi:hypothetical protein